jgi:hypothetical protein
MQLRKGKIEKNTDKGTQIEHEAFAKMGNRIIILTTILIQTY